MHFYVWGRKKEIKQARNKRKKNIIIISPQEVKDMLHRNEMMLAA